MASPAPSRAPAFAQIAPRRNTLQVLRRGMYGFLGLDLVLFLACAAGAGVHRNAIQTIGRDSAPSIVAAQRIRTGLEDMDANAADDLLSGDAENSRSRRHYEQRRAEVTQALIDAAQNITYGREERDPIERMQLQLGTYEARIQRARDLHDANNPGAIEAYEDATHLLDNVLVPAADDLDAVNFRRLDAAWSSQGGFSIASRILVLFTGVILISALLWMQSFLTDRTRRILNLPLAAATLGVLAFTMWALTVFATEERQLKIARQDAFTSMHALWKARSAAYALNADESRFLLDPARSAAAEQEMERNAYMVMKLPPGVTVGDVAENVLNPHGRIAFAGYFADEVGNITFIGEREAMAWTVLNFGQYLRINRTVVALQNSGKHADAVALCIGTRPGEAKYAFWQFDDALSRTLDINQRAFHAATQTAFEALSNFEVKAAGVAAVIAVLIVMGLMQRIAEYR